MAWRAPRAGIDSGGSEIVLVLNWFEELTRLVPVDSDYSRETQ